MLTQFDTVSRLLKIPECFDKLSVHGFFSGISAFLPLFLSPVEGFQISMLATTGRSRHLFRHSVQNGLNYLNVLNGLNDFNC